MKRLSTIVITSYIVVTGSSYTTQAIKLHKIKLSSLSTSMSNLTSSSNLNINKSKNVSTSTSALNTGTKSTNKIKNLFSSSSKGEKSPYTLLDYIRGKKITTEMCTQTESPKFRDVGTQYDPPTSSQPVKTQGKSSLLNIFSKKKTDLNKTLSPIDQEQKATAKLTTYSHEYRQLERTQIELIKKHQEALQKTLNEYLKLLSPDSDQPSTSTSTNLKNNQLNLQERNLKISELNEKIKDMKQIGSDIKSVSSVIAGIEPLKREVREEKLLADVSIQGKNISVSQTNQPKKKLMKLNHLDNWSN